MMSRVDGKNFARWLAITLLIVAHSIPISPGPGYVGPSVQWFKGGMSILLFLSGISFASMVIKPSGPDTIRSMIGFIWKIVALTMIFELVAIAIKGRVDIYELLLIINWVHFTSVAFVPIWYVAMLVQLFLVLSLLFLMPGFANWYAADTKRGSLVIFGFALAALLIAKLNFDARGLHDRLPHLHAWIFIFGWVYVAFLESGRATTQVRICLSAVAICNGFIAYAAYGAYGHEWGVRAAWLTVATLFVIWVTSFRAPRWFAQVVALGSQATLFIFLFHIPFMRITDVVLQRVAPASVESLGGMAFRVLAGWGGPVVIWALWNASTYTERKFSLTKRGLMALQRSRPLTAMRGTPA